MHATAFLLVPTLRVGMQSGRSASRVSHALDAERLRGIPTRSVGTRNELIKTSGCETFELKGQLIIKRSTAKTSITLSSRL